MIDPVIQPVILAGGNGTRLWPLSRPSHPKQFARILGEESLFQAAARRLAAEGALTLSASNSEVTISCSAAPVPSEPAGTPLGGSGMLANASIAEIGKRRYQATCLSGCGGA